MEAILQKISDGALPAKAVLVFSDKASAEGLNIARNYNLPTQSFSAKDFPSFEAYEENLVNELKKAEAEWVVCAGYMRIIRSTLLGAYRGKILNIHPSLLPSFTGLHAQKQALDYGVKVTGCTVHFIDEGVDTGKIILQTAVEVKESDSLDELTARILKAEHELYWKAIAQVIQ